MAGRAKTIVHPTKMTVYSIFLFCIVRLFDFGKIKKLKEIKKIKTIVGGVNNHSNNITLYSFVQSTLLFTLYPLLFTLYSLPFTLYSLSTLYCIAEMWSSMRNVESVVVTSMVAFSPKRRAIR